MIDQKRLADIQKEMTFTVEMWKMILEAEAFVRKHYLKLAEREIYDLHDEEPDF